ncbi:MAG: NAD(P)H-dependent oxidoreductase [Desulfobulbaceae bacterium]
MARVLIIYASDYGNTEKMALAAAEGANLVDGVETIVKKAEEVTADDMTSSDGVIVGSPVHMGAVDWRVKKFIDTVCSGLWMQDKMNGKVAGVFTSGGGFGGAGGGTEIAMLSILNNFAELGMLIVPLPKNTENYTKGGLHWGPYGRSADENMEHVGVTDEALAVAKKHVANVARAALAVSGATIFVP